MKTGSRCLTDGSEAEGQAADGQATADDQAAEETGASEAQLTERTQALVPQTIEDILAFADGYNAPEQVEAVFSWDVSDVFYNYFFLGNYVNVGGRDGDDETQIDIYNLDAIRCLEAYQELTQYFSIDPEEVSYESVAQDFLDGKLVFTIATTDMVSRLEQASADGSFPYAWASRASGYRRRADHPEPFRDQRRRGKRLQ